MSTTKYKKLKVSKNRKKTWRKHTNIDEIEEFLEDKRLEERIGKTEEDSNKPLFFIEKCGDVVEETDAFEKPDEEKKKKVLTTKDIVKDLKVHKSLKSTSAVKAMFNSKRCGSQIPKKLKSKNLAKRVEMSKKHIEKAKKQKTAQLEGIDNPAFYDLWNETEEKHNSDSEMEELQELQKTLIGKNKPKISAYRFQKSSLLAAVEPPHPGTSYNPSFEDHQDLLQKANEIELKKAKEEAHLKRVLDDFIPEKYDADKQWLEEMSQGLNEPEENEETEVNESNEVLIPSSLKNTKRKLKAQRRREERQKKLQSETKARKEQNQRTNQIYNLKKFEKEIREAEEKSKRKQKKRDEKRIAKMYTPRIISRHKFEEPEIEISLSSEISGNLRSIKTEGDLLEDRFASLQKRNIIEPRVRILKHRKKHVKYFVKRHCRE